MAFKMKAGKEGPMKKNFGQDISPMDKPLVGNQDNLQPQLQQQILDSPNKLAGLTGAIRGASRGAIKGAAGTSGAIEGAIKGARKGFDDAKKKATTKELKTLLDKGLVGEKGGVTGRSK